MRSSDEAMVGQTGVSGAPAAGAVAKRGGTTPECRRLAPLSLPGGGAEMRKILIVAVAAAISGALAARAPAQGEGLHGITDPGDAHRHADEAHRAGRHDEELYWQRYEAGLHEQRANQRGRHAEERYWHEYEGGLR